MMNDLAFEESGRIYGTPDTEELFEKPVIISYSEVFKWDTCQRQYYYRFGLGLKPLEESNAISTGIKGHRLLQAYYTMLQEGKPVPDALEAVQRMAKQLMEQEKIGDFSLLQAWVLVDNYIKSLNIDNAKTAVLVENRFLFPMSKLTDDPALAHVQVGFTPDVVFERTGGFMDVEDSKFIQRAWPKSKINRFPQAKLYQIFLKMMGYPVGRSSIRFFNVKTGLITVQNYTLTSAEEQTLIHDFVGAAKEVITYKQQSEALLESTRRTMNYGACQFCHFERPCTMQAEGKDASKTLKYEYEKSTYDYNS